MVVTSFRSLTRLKNGVRKHLVLPTVYAVYPERDIEKDLKSLKRQLKHRMMAGSIAVAFLQEW